MVYKKNLKKLRKVLNKICIIIKELGIQINCNQPSIIINSAYPEKTKILLHRYFFYFPNLPVKKTSLIRGLFSNDILLLYGFNIYFIKFLSLFRKGIYNVDYDQNPMDEWRWNKALYYAEYAKKDPSSEEYFNRYIHGLLKEDKECCYIFGTGPSLEKAFEFNWSNGYRIVCNTIVGNKELWNHIDPHIIVAVDALYHFSDSAHAKLFRKDLYERLKETNTAFMYPSIYHPIVIREFFEYSNRLFPIPEDGPGFFYSLFDDFRLPSELANVVTVMLIPVACTLSKTICLWGFDGRGPDDSNFWKNSHKSEYTSNIELLKSEHPAFFKFLVPDQNPFLYVHRVLGDQLDELLSDLENRGFTINMLHKSWTVPFQKRFDQNFANRQILMDASAYKSADYSYQ